MPSIRVAKTDDEIRACYPVMVQLRPHLTGPDDLLARVRRQEAEGFTLAFVEHDGRPVAIAGFRIQEMLHRGRFLYVDDLVTDEAARSGGHGAALMAWLRQRARDAGCVSLELESGVQRFRAHRFYFREGMHVASYHFAEPL